MPDNRDPNIGKVDIEDKTQVDESPFFTLKPLRLRVVGHEGVKALFQIEVVLETHSLHTKKRLEPYLHRIYSALFEDLYGTIFLLWGSGYTPHLMGFKKRLQRVVMRVVSKDLIKDVLVQNPLFKEVKAL